MLLEAFINKRAPIKRYQMFKLCFEGNWICLDKLKQAFKQALSGSSVRDKYLYDVLKDLLKSSSNDSSTEFVKALHEHRPSIFARIEESDFPYLYGSNKVYLKMAKHFCTQQNRDTSPKYKSIGLNMLARQRTTLVREGNDGYDFGCDFDTTFHLFIWSLLMKNFELSK